MRNAKEPVHIFDGIFWVGAQDPSLRQADALLAAEQGTSYNSYLVMGAEKTALVDTVKEGFLQKSLALIRQLMDPARIDYILLPHAAPEHSGSLRGLLAAAPNAQVVCSQQAAQYLRHIVNREFPFSILRDNEVLDLGGKRRLRCLSAPFLYWPDTFFLHEARSQGLFTGDAFAAHFSAERVLASRTDPAYREAQRPYYEGLMKPHAPYVLRAVTHLRKLELPISAILPAHGPVLDQEPMDVVSRYAKWAEEAPRLVGNRLFIGYASCGGYTRRMAARLYERVQILGLNVEMRDLTQCPLEEALTLAAAADAVAIGSPTVNADALPPVWDFLARLSVPVMRGRCGTAFGSFGWSGEAVPLLEARLTALGFRLAGDGVSVRLRPGAKDMGRMDRMGEDIALALRG